VAIVSASGLKSSKYRTDDDAVRKRRSNSDQKMEQDAKENEGPLALGLRIDDGQVE
jgi:hypothetical protein